MPDELRVYVDFTTNHLSSEEGAGVERDSLRKLYESRIESIVQRKAKLPFLMVHMGAHTSLLVEARSLFSEGWLYSCVAM